MTDWVGKLQNNQQQNQRKQTTLNPILSLLGGGLGAITGGGLGGLAGIETGPGALATGYLGGVVGAGIGAGMGNQAANTLNSIFSGQGIPKGYSQQDIQGDINAAKSGAFGQTIGGPLAKLLGFVAHPIATTLGPVDRILANSPKTINFINYLNKVGGQGVDELAAKGVGQQAQQFMTDTLAPNLRAAAQQAVGHIPGIGATINLDQGIPLTAANYLKRNLSSGLQYGEQEKPSQELTKTAVRYLKDAIQEQEPSIEKYNKAASILYKIPDFAQNVASILPGKGAQAIDMLANLLKFAPQKAIPQGGGYLNQAIPRGLQFLFGGIGSD